MIALLLTLAVGTVATREFSYQDLVTTANARPVVFRGRPAVAVEVINHTNVLVSAWKVEVQYTLSNGKVETQRKLTDMYGAADTPSDLGKLPGPGGGVVSETFLVVLPAGVTVESATARVLCAVFADGTWLGDQLVVQEIFNNRAREEAAWTFVLDAIQAGRARSGVEGLRAMLQHLSRPDQDDYENSIKKVMRQNVTRAINRDASIRVDPDEFLRAWLARADASRRVASAHRERKGERRAR